jgi:hypothetical protein
MSYGVIKAFAITWSGSWPIFRLLVTNDAGWHYLYVGASNYRFGMNDIVSWGDGVLYWRANNQTIKFDLLQTAVVTK